AATPKIYTLSLHDALPIYHHVHQHDVDVVIGQQLLDTPATVGGVHHRHAVELEHPRDGQHIAEVVVDQQDLATFEQVVVRLVVSLVRARRLVALLRQHEREQIPGVVRREVQQHPAA